MKAADAKTSRRAQCGGIYSYLSAVDEMWKLKLSGNAKPRSSVSNEQTRTRFKAEKRTPSAGRKA